MNLKERMLTNARENAQKHIAAIENIIKNTTIWTGGESDMTADYIWGNCTLEELLKVLNENDQN
jgi:hypothetical protein